MHVEGVVTIHIRVLPDGAVEVLGVTRGLGHGLDESAKRAITSWPNSRICSLTQVEWVPVSMATRARSRSWKRLSTPCPFGSEALLNCGTNPLHLYRLIPEKFQAGVIRLPVTPK
jgi:hypothetical protein